MRALLLAMLIAGSGCTHAPVKEAPRMGPHYTAAIFFHTCGFITALELVNSDGHLFYYDWYKTDDDVFDAAVQVANSLGISAGDVEVGQHCMKA